MSLHPYILSAVLSVALLSVTAANAIIALPQCYWAGEYDAASDTQPRREGSEYWPNGFTLDRVSYGPNDIAWQAEIGAEITECSSGRMLVIEIVNDINSYRQLERLTEFLQEESQSSNTLDQVQRLAQKAGYSATLFTDDEERCGCSTFYPELRGDKTPFDIDKYYGVTE